MSEPKEIGKKRKRPEIVNGRTEMIVTGCGNMYLTINEMDGEPFEVFVYVGKSGGCAMAMSEAICRLVSLHLRCGGDIADILKQLRGIGCPTPHSDAVRGTETLSCPDAIAQLLSRKVEKVV